MMTEAIFLISPDGELSWFKDEVSCAELTVFKNEGRIYGQVRFLGIDGYSTGEIVVGPMVHAAPLIEGFEGYLREIEAIGGKFRFIYRDGSAAELPRRPDLPRYRTRDAPFMSSEFVTAILTRAQECLDAGDAPVPPTLRFEGSYEGPRVEQRTYEFYDQRSSQAVIPQPPAVNEAEERAKAEALAVQLFSNNGEVDFLTDRGERHSVVVGHSVNQFDLPATGASGGLPSAGISPTFTQMGEMKQEEADAAYSFLAKLPRMISIHNPRVCTHKETVSSGTLNLYLIPGAGAPVKRNTRGFDWNDLPYQVVERELREKRYLLDAKRKG